MHSVHRVVSLALVQLADGSREVDALIQPNNNELEPRGGERTRSQLVLASEHARDIPWVHWVLRPHPTATGPNPRWVRDPGVGTRCSARRGCPPSSRLRPVPSVAAGSLPPFERAEL